jgi:hypothetical protein
MRFISSLFLGIALIGSIANAASKSRHLIKLNEENWQDVLRGEWMIEFQVLSFLIVRQLIQLFDFRLRGVRLAKI